MSPVRFCLTVASTETESAESASWRLSTTMANEPASVWRPDWAVSPGDLLGEALDERSMTQAELARRMGRPLKTINEIIKGKQAITADTTVQLEKVLGIPAHFWANLQADFDEWNARAREAERLSRAVGWVDRFPTAAMARRGWITGRASKVDLMNELLGFFGVATPDAWRAQWAVSPAAYRQSPSFRSRPEAVAAWLRRGEIKAARIECKPFSERALRDALPQIRAMTVLDPSVFLARLRRLLADCGVAFVMTAELQGIHLAGATRWLGPDKVVVQLSLRHKTDDHFWFALFHELGHVLSSRKPYLDDARTVDTYLRTPNEVEADKFAASQLVPDRNLEAINLPELTADQVRAIAADLGVAPGIVVGRLEYSRGLGPARFRHLKQSWELAEV
jgi:HTH-type transcriptional regulator/antitoxin HigA